MYKKTRLIVLFLSAIFLYSTASAINFPATIFPLERYKQDLDLWLSPQAPQYKQPLLTAAYQKERANDFHRHLFSTDETASSPWSKNFVIQVLNKKEGVLSQVKNSLTESDNAQNSKDRLSYGGNCRPHPPEWIDAIAANIDLQQFALPIPYKTANRAIVFRNTYARMLPTHEPSFYNIELAGQGYPFDNLQASVVWAGTPVYIIGQTKDQAWSLVMTSSFVAWVETDSMANANATFIKRWQQLAKQQLIAVTRTKTPIVNAYNKKYQLSAYIGTVFPLSQEQKTDFKIWIPLRAANGNAVMQEALIAKSHAVKTPLPATPENFSKILASLKNRSYGWGNMYFYNDCSAELQNLYTPFGIWLPRNSSQQNMAGKVADVSALSAEKRLDYLIKNGHPLTTIVFIGRHVFMYLGSYPDPNNPNHALVAMSYQNLWGLGPKDGSRRAIIGQSIVLPLLLSYPEDASLNTMLNAKQFQIIYLDQWPETTPNNTDLFFKTTI